VWWLRDRDGPWLDRCGVLERDAFYLRRVDDAGARMSTYCSIWASKPWVWGLFSLILPTTIEPSTPASSAIWRIGAPQRLSTMLMPAWTSGLLSLSLPTAALARSKATPAPRTMPSSLDVLGDR